MNFRFVKIPQGPIPPPLSALLASLHSLLLHLRQVVQCSVPYPLLADIACHYVSLYRSKQCAYLRVDHVKIDPSYMVCGSKHIARSHIYIKMHMYMQEYVHVQHARFYLFVYVGILSCILAYSLIFFFPLAKDRSRQQLKRGLDKRGLDRTPQGLQAK